MLSRCQPTFFTMSSPTRPGVDASEFSVSSSMPPLLASTGPGGGANASQSRKRGHSHSTAHHPLAPSSSSSHHHHHQHCDGGVAYTLKEKERRRRGKAEEGGGRSKSQAELVRALSSGLLFTPFVEHPSPPFAVPATAPSSTQTPFSQNKRASSSPQFVRPRSGSSSSATVVVEPTPAPYRAAQMDVSSDDDEREEDDEDDALYLARPGRSYSQIHMRPRKLNVAAVNRWREEQLADVSAIRSPAFAGETETELEEEPIHPRQIPQNQSLIPLLIEFLVPYLFEATRWLSVVPAVFGTLYNMHNIIHPPPSVNVTIIDYAISALWAILTGFQCLALTTGLLTRWKVYYATLSTLIRLVALQAICWPATHFTLLLFNHSRRPVVCWAIIGTTTCFSRSVQLWVTSNILVGRNSRGEGRLGPRRWDWGEVGRKCVLPAGFLYFITAWLLLLKGELLGIS